MKITIENVIELPITENEKILIHSLLADLQEINHIIPHKLYIEFQDWHNEYSPERTDPCPDYYGTYRICNEYDDELIGVEMTLDELDSALCLLSNFVDYEFKKEVS